MESSGAYTVFIVDDDPLIHEMLGDHLKKFKNIKIHSFPDGEKALAQMSLNPNIIVLDYNLTGSNKDAMDGLAVLKKIKQVSPDVEVVMLSGQEKIEIAVNTMKFGAFDYVVKNENAFLRTENALFNILRKFRLVRDGKLYRKLFMLSLIAFILMLMVFGILFFMGYIKNPWEVVH